MDDTEGIQTKVKQELSLCAACMSKHRRVSTLKAHNSKIFIYLLGQYADLVSPDSVVLCWECSAVLNRICRFQHQVQAAQIALMQTLNPEVENLQSLSTLITTMFGVTEYSPMPTILNKCCDSTPLLSGDLLDVKEMEVDPSITLEEEKYSIKVEEKCQQISAEIDCKEGCVLNQTEILEEEGETVIDDANLDNSDNQIQDKTSRLKMKKSKMKFSEYLDLRKNLEIDLEKCSEWFSTSTLTTEEAALGGIFRGAEHSKTGDSCKACRIPFLNTLDYHRHNTFWHVLKKNSKGPFECEECHERCADKESLRLHWSVHNTILRCCVCRQAVDAAGGGAAAMRKHLKSHAYLYSCTACRLPDATFNAYRDFYFHCRELHTKYLCDHCGTVRRSKATLVNHVRKFHDPETLKKKEAPELRYCVECNKEFRSVGAYRKHLNSSKLHNPRYNPKKRDPTSRVCGNKNIRDRTRIIDLHQQGYKISEIARELKTTRGTVRHWVRRFDKDGSLADLPRGRPSWRRVSPQQVEQMVRHLENFPDTSTKVYAQQYACSTRTIRTLLHKAGLGHYLKNPAQKRKK